MLTLAGDVESDETALVADRVRGGASIGEAFAAVDEAAWRVLAAAWRLAEASGAPVGPALDRIAVALRGIAEAGRRREVLLAGPRTTARLVSLLPLASVAVGFVLGFDPLPVFLTAPGLLLLVGGLLLQAVGARWARALVARVASEDRIAGLECELLWIALAGGAPPPLALRNVADAVSWASAEWVELEALRAATPLARAVASATAAGAPASALLLEAAGELRARTQATIEREAERLAVRVLVPLACCVLPAFVALGVVPVIVTLLGDFLVG